VIIIAEEMSADGAPYQLRGQAGSREVDSWSWRTSSGFSASNLRHGARSRSSAQRSARRVEAGIEVAQKRVLRWRHVSELDASVLNEPWWVTVMGCMALAAMFAFALIAV